MDAKLTRDLDKRISACTKSKLLKKPDYLEYGSTGNLEAVYCKICGARIRSLVEDGAHTKEYQRGGKIIREVRYVLTCNPNYTEVKFQLDDQGFHVTNCCTSCAPKVQNDPDLQDAAYEADLMGWKQEEKKGVSHLFWNDRVVNRKAVRDN